MTIFISVISDELSRAKEFAKKIMNVDSGKVKVADTSDGMTIFSDSVRCRATVIIENHEGTTRYHKIYVDELSEKSIKIFNESYRGKIIPIYLDNTYVRLDVNNQIEVLNFDELLKV